MSANLPENAIEPNKRQAYLRSFPSFASLNPAQINELAHYLKEVDFEPNAIIVQETDVVDSIFIIVQGEAEVTRLIRFRKKTKIVPIAILKEGEAIGLTDTGFYSTTGVRTATVTAKTKMRLLKLDIKDLFAFLNKYHLESTMRAASLQMMRMQLIKLALPFSRISHERLLWLANHVDEMQTPAGTILFKQGDQGDRCYLIKSGQVEILSTDNDGTERSIALLKPNTLFGEATLITKTPRNATAKVVTDAELLVLSHQYLTELIESEDNVANMFMTLMIDRSKPEKNPAVTVHKRLAADKQEVVILKNPNGNYFKLSKEGYFIWQQLDGKQTMQDITLNLAERFQVFAPDMVAALISKLSKNGFISNLAIQENFFLANRPFWARAIVKLRQLLETRFAFGDADKWVTSLYQKYFKYLLTKSGLIFLGIVVVLGFISFSQNTKPILEFFSKQPVSLFLLLALFPLSLVVALLHELGHAFAMKAFGREVHYIGLGWYWVRPVAFIDTSDMWLSPRKERMLVNIIGIFVDALVAGIAALLILVIPNPYLQSMLWLFALYTYIGGFRHLSPLQEMDAYYVLMDGLDKPKLRRSAVLWLIHVFPKALRNPELFRGYKAEIIYWLACLAYLILISSLILLIQKYIFAAMGVQAKPYVSLILPLLVVLFSCITILAEIKSQQTEE